MIPRILGIGLALILSATIFWAFSAASFSESFGRIIADPWGIVSLVDLYVGFVITSVLIYVVERGRPISWAFILPTFVLGNVVTGFWLAWRAALLMGLLRRQA